jgi:hypothetical protein
VKGICKNSPNPSKDQTSESWASRRRRGAGQRVHNIFNKIIVENFPNLMKELITQVKGASRTPNRLDQNRTSPRHIIIKTTSIEKKDRILKAIREKKQITYKGKPIKITTDFSTETLKSRTGSEVF